MKHTHAYRQKQDFNIFDSIEQESRYLIRQVKCIITKRKSKQEKIWSI